MAPGRYQILAAINAVHTSARRGRETDWSQVVALYDQLVRIDLSPIVVLNRAIAIAELDGPEVALATIDRLAACANATGLILHQGIERGLVTFKPAGAGGAGADGAEASAEVAIEGAEASEAVDGGLIALNASLDWIPVAGEVVIVGTGVYLAGDALYHWKPFRDVANAVGHATVRVVDDGVGKIEHGMDSFISSMTDWGSF